MFRIEEDKTVQGTIKFYRLYKDGVCLYKEFEDIIKQEGTFRLDLEKLSRIFDSAASIGDKRPNQKHFKEIGKKGDSVKLYEAKSGGLRAYLFHEEGTGRIIVLGGKKSTQPKDIKHFRNLVNEYLETKK